MRKYLILAVARLDPASRASPGAATGPVWEALAYYKKANSLKGASGVEETTLPTSPMTYSPNAGTVCSAREWHQRYTIDTSHFSQHWWKRTHAKSGPNCAVSTADPGSGGWLGDVVFPSLGVPISFHQLPTSGLLLLQPPQVDFMINISGMRWSPSQLLTNRAIGSGCLLMLSRQLPLLIPLAE